jgi:hypothetical protein
MWGQNGVRSGGAGFRFGWPCNVRVRRKPLRLLVINAQGPSLGWDGPWRAGEVWLRSGGEADGPEIKPLSDFRGRLQPGPFLIANPLVQCPVGSEGAA